MGLDVAYQKATKDMAGISPYIAAAKTGVSFDGDKFTIPFFQRTFLLHHPQVKMEEVGSDQPPSIWLQIILMHYLLTSDGTPASGMWVTYRYLPGAFLFERRFNSWAIEPLIQALGKDIDGFRQAAVALGGRPMSRSGDAAFRFLALPKIPMGCILYLGDEEMSPSINMLFDGGAYNHLPTEDISYLGIYLSAALRGAKIPSKGLP